MNVDDRSIENDLRQAFGVVADAVHATPHAGEVVRRRVSERQRTAAATGIAATTAGVLAVGAGVFLGPWSFAADDAAPVTPASVATEATEATEATVATEATRAPATPPGTAEASEASAVPVDPSTDPTPTPAPPPDPAPTVRATAEEPTAAPTPAAPPTPAVDPVPLPAPGTRLEVTDVGIGPLRYDMSAEELLATGWLVEHPSSRGECRQLVGAPGVAISWWSIGPNGFQRVFAQEAVGPAGLGTGDRPFTAEGAVRDDLAAAGWQEVMAGRSLEWPSAGARWFANTTSEVVDEVSYIRGIPSCGFRS